MIPFGLESLMTVSLPIARRASKCFVPGACAIYLFDEGSGTALLDHSGNGNHGTLGADAAAPTWGATGLSFDGGDVVTLTGLGELVSAGFTIQAVVKPGADVATLQGVVTLGHLKAGTLGIGSGMYRNNAPTSADGKILNSAAGTVLANTWQSVAITTVWGGALATYVGGTASTTGTTTGAWTTPGATAQEIGSHGAIVYPFTGDIAAVLVYPTALAPAQVAQNHATLKALVAPRGITL